MFGDMDLGDIFLVRVFFVAILAIDKHDNISILLNGAGFTQIRELRNRGTPLLYGPRELGECEYRHIQLAGERFKRARYLGDLLYHIISGFVGVDELEVVYNDVSKTMLGFEASGHSAHLENGIGGLVINKYWCLGEFFHGIADTRKIV